MVTQWIYSLECDPLSMPCGPTGLSTCAFIYWHCRHRYPSLRETLHSLSELNQYPIIVFQREMAQRKEREITSYIMATAIHECVCLRFSVRRVKLEWNSWKWELLNLENMEDPNNKEKINCWWLKGTPLNNLTVCFWKKNLCLIWDTERGSKRRRKERRRRRRRGECRGGWRKNPCNTSQCFYGRFF